jgi:hypothetical protein
MQAELRRAVAYIGGRMISDSTATSVYDYDAGSYFSIDGEVSTTRVNVYDYSRSCYLDGNPPSLYDYGQSQFFDLELKGGQKFSGYDYGSSSFFDGEVKGDAVSIYDYGTGNYHDYSL